MKILNKRTPKRTKLHVYKCEHCGQKYGSYRKGTKTCSLKCKYAQAGLKCRKGCMVACKECGKETYRSPSQVKGRHARPYCSYECRSAKKKLGLPRGEYLSYDGYIVISMTPNGRKQIKKHRYIMEQHIGRKLKPTEIVHHINEDKLDNSIGNLQVMSRSEHNTLHFAGGGNGAKQTPQD